MRFSEEIRIQENRLVQLIKTTLGCTEEDANATFDKLDWCGLIEYRDEALHFDRSVTKKRMEDALIWARRDRSGAKDNPTK